MGKTLNRKKKLIQLPTKWVSMETLWIEEYSRFNVGITPSDILQDTPIPIGE